MKYGSISFWINDKIKNNPGGYFYGTKKKTHTRKKRIYQPRYREDDAEGWEDHSDRGDQRADKALPFVPNIGRAVDGDRSRRGLCDNGDVHHFIMSDPLLLLYAGVFDQCEHGISAAEGEQANLRKGQKEIK